MTVTNADLDDLRRQVHRAMERDRLCSVMNDTKWRELCMSFHAKRPAARHRMRDLLASGDFVSDWDGEWYYHPRPYVSIEWMEIAPVDAADLEEVVAAATQVGAVFERTDVGVRVYGYTRADRPPADQRSEA
jgi:hypothetical protein